MLHLKDYVWEVYELCKNNDQAPDVGVAYDMLRCNIENGYEMYPGTSLDWTMLNILWTAMTPEEQEQSRKEYHLCDNFTGGRAAFAIGNREEFERLKEAEFLRRTQPEEEAK